MFPNGYSEAHRYCVSTKTNGDPIMSNEFMPCRTASTVGQPMWVAPLFMGVKMRILMSLLVIAAFFTCLIFISDITFLIRGERIEMAGI